MIQSYAPPVRTRGVGKCVATRKNNDIFSLIEKSFCQTILRATLTRKFCTFLIFTNKKAPIARDFF
jgi:hypothetical protein